MNASSLILASGSARRRDLLSQAGFKFAVISPAVAESSSPVFSLAELTSLNAARKAFVVAARECESVVLAADTLVALDGEIIGKPDNLDHALAILRRLSGREHQVCTSVSIRSPRAASTIFSVMSHVKFRSLSDEQIRSYFAAINPLDKAGAYAAQGDGAVIIARIRGSYSNVVGLPMAQTTKALRALGVRPSVTS